MKWKGVMPAITTCFAPNGQLDCDFIGEHCRWLIENGCTGVVALGSLGEGGSLTPPEKLAVLETCVHALRGRAPVVAAISAITTSEAVSLAKAAEQIGCDALMILPPYVYVGDWHEMKTYVSAILRSTSLPGMLYNNPIAYRTDFLPEHIAELAHEHENLQAVKESSTDARRVSAIRALLDERLQVFVGVDDAILEGIGVGAVGWIAGLANAFPRESVDLFSFGEAGKREKASEIYRWFLPLLRLDTVPKFVQLIKLVQGEMGIGNARVRAPKLEIAGDELAATRKLIERALKHRPKRASTKLKTARGR